MKEYSIFVLNGLGSVSAILVLFFLTLRAFGMNLQFNESLGLIALVGATWVVLVSVYLKRKP